MQTPQPNAPRSPPQARRPPTRSARPSRSPPAARRWHWDLAGPLSRAALYLRLDLVFRRRLWRLPGAGQRHAETPMVFDVSGNELRWATSLLDPAIALSAAGHLRPGSDDAPALGGASARWSEVYAGTGVIHTSDARRKLSSVLSALRRSAPSGASLPMSASSSGAAPSYPGRYRASPCGPHRPGRCRGVRGGGARRQPLLRPSAPTRC